MSTAADIVLDDHEWNESNLRFFDRFDGPYTKFTVPLGNHALRKILAKHFEYMSRNLYFISAFGRYLLGYDKEEDVIKAEQIAKNTIENAIASMTRRIAQAKTMLENQGVEASVEYGKKKHYGCRIMTPGAKSYATLLKLADEYYSVNFLLWTEGLIDPKVKFANESEARKEIQGVVRGVASQFMFILNKTRAKSETEASKAGVHDEKKLVDEAVEVVDTVAKDNMLAHVGNGATVAAAPAATAAAVEAPAAGASDKGTSKTKKAPSAKPEEAAAAGA